jgi:hypothetical protein
MSVAPCDGANVTTWKYDTATQLLQTASGLCVDCWERGERVCVCDGVECLKPAAAVVALLGVQSASGGDAEDRFGGKTLPQRHLHLASCVAAS